MSKPSTTIRTAPSPQQTLDFFELLAPRLGALNRAASGEALSVDDHVDTWAQKITDALNAIEEATEFVTRLRSAALAACDATFGENATTDARLKAMGALLDVLDEGQP